MSPRSWFRGVGAGALAGGGVLATQLAATRRRSFLIDPPADELPRYFPGPGRELSFLAIGDSTGVGVGAGSRAHSYPALLARKLSATYAVTLNVLGRSGLRMGDVAARIADEAAGVAPDLILLGVGANDAIHLTPTRRLRDQTSAALDTLRSSGAAVLVALGPHMESPALQRPLRDAAAWRCRVVNRVIRAGARARRIDFIDTALLLGDAFVRDPHRYYCEDLFHPGPEGYALWADAIFPSLETVARSVMEDPRRPRRAGR